MIQWSLLSEMLSAFAESHHNEPGHWDPWTVVLKQSWLERIDQLLMGCRHLQGTELNEVHEHGPLQQGLDEVQNGHTHDKSQIHTTVVKMPFGAQWTPEVRTLESADFDESCLVSVTLVVVKP